MTASGARLSVRNDEFVQQLGAAPHLNGGFNPKRAMRLFLWIGGGLVVLAGLIYLTLNYAPQKIAVLLPDAWSERVGKQMEASLVDKAKVCHSPAGDSAVAAMLSNLAEGDLNMPPLQVRIYDIPIKNAFALPGGHIVITRGLLETAAAPDEVAGYLPTNWPCGAPHPEAQLVFHSGRAVLLSVATVTSGWYNTSFASGLAAILQSNRDAESEADAYAVSMLNAAASIRWCLKHFFERCLTEEGKPSGGL